MEIFLKLIMILPLELTQLIIEYVDYESLMLIIKNVKVGEIKCMYNMSVFINKISKIFYMISIEHCAYKNTYINRFYSINPYEIIEFIKKPKINDIIENKNCRIHLRLYDIDTLDKNTYIDLYDADIETDKLINYSDGKVISHYSLFSINKSSLILDSFSHFLSYDLYDLYTNFSILFNVKNIILSSIFSQKHFLRTLGNEGIKNFKFDKHFRQTSYNYII